MSSASKPEKPRAHSQKPRDHSVLQNKNGFLAVHTESKRDGEEDVEPAGAQMALKVPEQSTDGLAQSIEVDGCRCTEWHVGGGPKHKKCRWTVG